MSVQPITIRMHPHAMQREVHGCPARFRVVSAGRRAGKTRLGIAECIEVAAGGGRAWWVAPSYQIAQVGWRELRRICARIPNCTIQLAERTISFSGGGEVRIRSADDPDSLRGEGLDFVVLDEAAYIKAETWTEVLRPALSDRRGRALFISTPNGMNWFHDIWVLGQASEGEYRSFQFPTSANPHIPPEEIEAARAEMPEVTFRQEYEAEFLDSSGTVFRRVRDAALAPVLSGPLAGHNYMAGVDVAAAEDYTVVAVMDIDERKLVAQDRFTRVDYNVLMDRLEAGYRRWGLQLMKIESNSIGQPVIDGLRKRGLKIIPFLTTNDTKRVIIQELQSAFELSQITIINDPVLIGELLSYQAKRNPSGSFSYGAPDGMHDDCVMALAIAWSGLSQRMASSRQG